MSERLKHLGQRQELEQEKKSLELRIQGLIANLRDALDPLAKIEDLDPECIAAWSADLSASRDRFRAVIRDLKILEGILGK